MSSNCSLHTQGEGRLNSGPEKGKAQQIAMVSFSRRDYKFIRLPGSVPWDVQAGVELTNDEVRVVKI
jgi:hypothetical protein